MSASTTLIYNGTTYRIKDSLGANAVERLTATGWEASYVAGHWLLSVGHNIRRAVSAAETNDMKLER
jgi:hypothetical protein